MNALWRECAQVWLVSMKLSGISATARIVGGLAIFIVGVAMFMIQAAQHQWGLGIMYALGLPFGAWSVTAWFGFVRGAVAQNSPANARLVPRLRLRAIQTTALFWLSLATGFVLVFGLALKQPGLVFLCAGLPLIGMGLVSVGRWEGIILFQLILINSLARDYAGVDLKLLLAGGAPLAGALMLTMAIGAYALYFMFPDGGERHFSSTSKARKMRQAILSGDLSQLDRNKPLSFIGLSKGTYAGMLSRDSAKRRHLLVHSLGPQAHWSWTLLPALAALLALALAKPLLAVYARPEIVEGFSEIGWLLVAPLIALQLLSGQRLMLRISHTRGEQALLRLAPGMPAAARLNRDLMRVLLAGALSDWLWFTAVMMAAVALFGGDWAALGRLLSMCCLSLPFLAGMLRNYAAFKPQQVTALWMWYGLGLLALVLACLLLRLATGWPVWPLFALGGPLVAVLLIQRRWQGAVSAPVAFPAGRLAD